MGREGEKVGGPKRNKTAIVNSDDNQPDRAIKATGANVVKKPKSADKSTEIEAPSEDEAVGLEDAVLHPALQAILTLLKYNKVCGELDLLGLSESLIKQVQSATGGDLKRGVEMLTAQAHTLDAIFNNLAQRAALNMGEHMQACETYLKLALRAQSQCRATWETLATIKNPPMVGYVKQANIANGPQQVNNAPSSANPAPRARENENPQNKLLEKNHGKRLDTGETGTTGGIDPEMATVGKIDRTEDAGR